MTQLLDFDSPWKETQRMPYITSVERIGIEKGRVEGRAEGLREGFLAAIELALELKFGAAGLALLPEVRALTDLPTLQALHAAMRTATTLEAVRQVYTSAGEG